MAGVHAAALRCLPDLSAFDLVSLTSSLRRHQSLRNPTEAIDFEPFQEVFTNQLLLEEKFDVFSGLQYSCLDQKRY